MKIMCHIKRYVYPYMKELYYLDDQYFPPVSIGFSLVLI